MGQHINRNGGGGGRSIMMTIGGTSTGTSRSSSTGQKDRAMAAAAGTSSGAASSSSMHTRRFYATAAGKRNQQHPRQSVGATMPSDTTGSSSAHKSATTTSNTSFESSLNLTNNQYQPQQDLHTNRLNELQSQLLQYGFGYHTRTFHVVLTLYREKIPLTPQFASLVLASFYRAKRHLIVEFLAEHWFEEGGKVGKGLEERRGANATRKWIRETIQVYEKKATIAANFAKSARDPQHLQEMLQLTPLEQLLISTSDSVKALKEFVRRPAVVLPGGRKFPSPLETDYVTMLNSYAARAELAEFMETRANMKRTLGQSETSDSPSVVASMMKLFRQRAEPETVWQLFLQNFNSTLQSNPDKPDATIRQYIVLLTALAKAGDSKRAETTFQAMKQDLGENSVNLKALSALLNAYTRGKQEAPAWQLFSTHFHMYEDGSVPDDTTKLHPDSAVSTMMLNMFTATKNMERIRSMLRIVDVALKHDIERRKRIQDSSKWFQESRQTQINRLAEDMHVSGDLFTIPADSNDPPPTNKENDATDDERDDAADQENNDDDDDDDSHEKIVTFPKSTARAVFKIDYLITEFYTRACLVLGEPNRALDHFKEFYGTSLRGDQNNSALLLPSVRVYGMLMNMFASIGDLDTVVQLYEAVLKDHSVAAVATHNTINHVLLLMYARVGQFDEMMEMFEQRFHSFISENAQTNSIVLNMEAVREISHLMLKANRVDVLERFLTALISRPIYKSMQVMGLCRQLMEKACQEHYNAVAVYNIFKDVSVHGHVSVALSTLHYILWELQKSKNYSEILHIYQQMPLEAQYHRNFAIFYMRVVSQLYSFDHTWNEFVRIFDVPPNFQAVSTKHTKNKQISVVPSKFLDKTPSQHVNRHKPDINTFKALFNELTARGLYQQVEDLLAYAQESQPQHYNELYQFKILSRLRSDFDMPKAIRDMATFYNTPLSPDSTSSSIPPLSLYRELIFICSPQQLDVATELLSLFEKHYPKSVGTPVHSKLKRKVELLQIPSKQYTSVPVTQDREGTPSYTSSANGDQWLTRFQKLSTKEKRDPNTLSVFVKGFIEEGKLDEAIKIIPQPSTKVTQFDKNAYAKFVFHFAKSGSVPHLRQIIVQANEAGFETPTFADPIVIGLMEGGFMREAFAFFEKLYDVPLNAQKQKSMRRPSREIYKHLLGSLKLAAKADKKIQELHNQVKRSFLLQFK